MGVGTSTGVRRGTRFFLAERQSRKRTATMTSTTTAVRMRELMDAFDCWAWAAAAALLAAASVAVENGASLMFSWSPRAAFTPAAAATPCLSVARLTPLGMLFWFTNTAMDWFSKVPGVFFSVWVTVPVE